MAQQLTLGLRLRDEATFANFYPGENATLLAQLQSFLSPEAVERVLYFYGPTASGRTHLLQACCHALPSVAVMMLDLADTALTPAVLVDMESCYLICLDNIGAVLGRPDWEQALFHFYNRAKEQGARLLISGDVPPGQLPCALPDLRSRLGGGLVFPIQPLTDDQKINALQLRARRRGLILSKPAGKFLLTHYPRDMNALFSALDTLDQASLAAKRRLTIPFIKQSL